MGLLSRGKLRIYLAIINIIFFILGGACVGLGAWQAVDKIFISDVIGSDLYSTAAYLLIFAGCVLVIISCVGCVGTVMQNRPILILYMITIILTVILLIAAGAVAASFQNQLGSSMIENMKNTIRYKYGNNVENNAENKRVTNSWDTLQRMLECCAVDNQGWQLYRDSEWFKQVNPHNYIQIDQNTIFVPTSCCRHQGAYSTDDWLRNCQRNPYGPPRYYTPNHSENKALIYVGCREAAMNFIKNNIGSLIGCGFGFGITLIFGIVFAFLLYRNLAEPFVPVATREH
ncbi:CD82 antigen-like [Saccostrea echinata]|uniref:CD82 antigen-like n=1 Tax=Saccostrea echinata TaxID=191078 RepID=UPI002A822A47|nr:CD82 antigen-like [Saccostrea echinata]